MQGLGLSGELSEPWTTLDSYVELGRQCWRFHQKETESDLRRSLLTEPCCRPREGPCIFLPGPGDPWHWWDAETDDSSLLQLFRS